MEKKKVLITGITGLVGSVLMKGLGEEFDVTGIDLRVCPDVKTLVADSTNLDEIISAFEGVDTVIDLASEPSNFAPWDVIYANNLRCTF
ncbi:MAG: NAD-dependent epimerase/dehydratase family protein, partial [Chloroflexota bacterium]|nr:NAD-dependent epimerase/dehydratase family protein [Chloroflexota bacterium]